MIKTEFITRWMRIKRVRVKFKLRLIWFIFPINRFFLKRSDFEILHDTYDWRSILRFFIKHSNNDLCFILIDFTVKRCRRIIDDIHYCFHTCPPFKRMNFIISFIKQNSKQKNISLFCKVCCFMRLKFKYFWCFVSIIFSFVPVCLNEGIYLIFDSICCEYVKFDHSIAHYTNLIRSEFKQKLVIQVQVMNSST